MFIWLFRPQQHSNTKPVTPHMHYFDIRNICHPLFSLLCGKFISGMPITNTELGHLLL